jgi:MFS family permease
MSEAAPPGVTGTSRTVGGLPFRLLWSGQTVSVLGDGIALLALPLLVLERSGGPILAAVAAAPQPVAYAVGGLLAGPVVDRLDSRRLMIVCDVLRAALFGLLTWLALLDGTALWLLLTIALLAALCGVFFETAHAALIQEILDRESLVAGNSRLELSNQLGNLTGPVIAGVAATAASIDLCLLVNALTYVASVLTLAVIPGLRRAKGSPGLAPSRLVADLRQGLRYLWSHRLIRALTGLQTLINFAVAAETLVVFFASRTLHGGSFAVSLVVASAAVGGITGAALAQAAGRRWEAVPIVLAAVTALGGALGLASLARNLFWLGTANLAIGACSVLATVHIRALRLRIVPPDMIGRITSVARTMAVIAYPVGIVLAGTLTGLAGDDPRYAFGVAGVLAVGCALAARNVVGSHSGDGQGRPGDTTASDTTAGQGR